MEPKEAIVVGRGARRRRRCVWQRREGLKGISIKCWKVSGGNGTEEVKKKLVTECKMGVKTAMTPGMIISLMYLDLLYCFLMDRRYLPPGRRERVSAGYHLGWSGSA